MARVIIKNVGFQQFLRYGFQQGGYKKGTLPIISLKNNKAMVYSK